jgi:hypothetical protein
MIPSHGPMEVIHCRRRGTKELEAGALNFTMGSKTCDCDIGNVLMEVNERKKMPTLTMQSHTATAKHCASTHSFDLEEAHQQYLLSSRAKEATRQTFVTAMQKPTFDAISMALLILGFAEMTTVTRLALHARLTLFTALSFCEASDPYRSCRS